MAIDLNRKSAQEVIAAAQELVARSTRDRRTDSVKTLYASNTRYTKNSVIFEFDDPSLPTEQLVLKANLKDGKIKKGGIELRTQSGTVQN